MIARRSLTDPTDITYFPSNAPLAMAVERLTQVVAARATIEQCLETAKGETGLDEYEVRYWHSWHRHITLAIMAQAWLAASQTVPSLALSLSSRPLPFIRVAAILL